MYTLDYLNCFIENLDLPEASRASLRENCETLVTTPGAIDELVSAETLLFKDYGIDGAYGAEWKPIMPHMDALSERTGLHRHGCQSPASTSKRCRFPTHHQMPLQH